MLETIMGVAGCGSSERKLLQADAFSKGWVLLVGNSSRELLSVPLSPGPVGGLGVWGCHVEQGPFLPGNVLFPWLPQRCLRTANRLSEAWGLGQPGMGAVLGVPADPV